MVQPNRQVYLDYLARCEQAFRPFAPINLPDFFQGRRDRIDLLVGELKTAGRQVAIYGERGVGKTSLALLAGYFADYDPERVQAVRCEKESTYATTRAEENRPSPSTRILLGMIATLAAS